MRYHSKVANAVAWRLFYALFLATLVKLDSQKLLLVELIAREAFEGAWFYYQPELAPCPFIIKGVITIRSSLKPRLPEKR